MLDIIYSCGIIYLCEKYMCKKECTEYCLKSRNYNCCWHCDKAFCTEQCEEFKHNVLYEYCCCTCKNITVSLNEFRNNFVEHNVAI